MPWLLLLFALAAFGVAFTTASVGVLVVCLLLAFVLSLAGVMQLLARRIDSRSGGAGPMLDPDELRRLREQAEARKLAASRTDASAG